MPEPDAHSTKPATAWWQRLLLLAVGVVAGLAFAEVAVRLVGAAPEVVLVQEGRFRLSPNPKIGYEPVPDFEYHGQRDSFHDYQGKSNSLGFRDREHPVAKPPGSFRILVLGDSVAAGQGVGRYEDTFPSLLEKLLRDGGLEAEVLNFAVTGYNTQQEVETLRDKGLAYDPDLVLLSYCLNDRKRSDGGILPTLLAREKSAQGVLRSRAHPLLIRSALYRYLRYRLPWGQKPTPPIYGDTVDEYFGVLAELAESHGFEVLVTVFPHFGKLLEEYRFHDEHRRTQALAQGSGFYYLDLLEAFRTCRRNATGRLAIDRYHPTALGHRCAAREMAQYVLLNRQALGAGGAG